MRTLVCIILGLVSSLAASGIAWGACTIQPIDFGETRNGVIATDDCKNTTNNTIYYYDSYTFSGVAGQKIAVTMNTTSSIDPFLFVGVAGNIPSYVSDNNSGGGLNARVPATGFLTLTQTGTYEIQAVTAVPLTTGSYTLSLTSSTPAACSVAASPQSSATLPLAPNTPVQISAVCGSGTAPITYTWDSGAFVGAVRNVTPAATTTYNIVASNVNGSSPPFSITVHVAVPPPGVPTIEFYNIDLKHYFVTAVQAEATAIDNGSAGPGWVRTGFSYDVYNGPVNQGSISTSPVCRFYGTPGVGPNSHFYTADANECAIVKKDPGWFYEGIAYHIQAPVNGNCPAGTQQILRLYNNRAQFNDSNHRFTNNQATFDQMGEKGWNKEGLVMCTSAVRSPTPVLGGNFPDPAGSGAAVSIPQGDLPPYVNATQPQTSATPPGRQQPAGVINPSEGDTNVTKGSSTGSYEFTLTGDGGFSSMNAVTINVPFNAAGIPAADVMNPAKVFVRAYHADDGTRVDLMGSISVNGPNGMVSVQTQGLPPVFTASVVYNPDMDTDTGDQAASDVPGLEKSTTATVWAGRGWCAQYNTRNAGIVQAAQAILGLARAPTKAEIKSVIRSRITNFANNAQAIYQTDNFNGPNMATGLACGGTTPRYYVHVGQFGGSFFQGDDPGAPINAEKRHYGRLYVEASRMMDASSTVLGSSLASIAHEMFHAVQNGYRILGTRTFAYQEGGATTYGKTIDNGNVLAVRTESTLLNEELLNGVYKSNNQYGSEDFWAYLAKAYNGGKLNYLSGLYASMRSNLGPNQYNPPRNVTYQILDTYLTSTFKKTLPDAYMEFVRDRSLTHPPAGQLRAGENLNGLTPALFAASVATQNIDVTTCNKTTATLNAASGFQPFTSLAITVNPTGNLPANSNGITLQVTVTPTNGAMGTAWKGWSYRKNAATAMTATITKFTLWGKPADPLVLVLSNVDRNAAAGVKVEINCAGVTIDSLSPVRGKVGDVVTISGSGFGAQADPRTVTFNGVTATAVTWVSDTQLRATVPVNASSGDVFVTANGEKSNGVPFEVFAACSAQQTAGGDTPDLRTIELGKPSGTFNFHYETFSQEDQIIVRYPNSTGTVLFDTGCVGANGTRALSYNGAASTISVQVIPNCKGGTGTAWNYTVSCP